LPAQLIPHGTAGAADLATYRVVWVPYRPPVVGLVYAHLAHPALSNVITGQFPPGDVFDIFGGPPVVPRSCVPDPVDQPREAEELSLSAILMLERHPNEAAFVWSLVHDLMRVDLWLWHEDDYGHALNLLSYSRFRLILLDSTFAPRLSLRTLIRRIQAVARGTPVILRLPPEALPPNPDPRIYGVAAVVSKCVGGPTERAIRQTLGLT
jgi:hypothetical protein